MTDEPSSEETDERFEASVLTTESWHPSTGRLLAPLTPVVGMLPSFKDTKKGRQAGMQIRVVILATGALLAVFGGDGHWIAIGLALAIAGLFLPLSEVRKRALKARLKRAQSARQRERESPGSIVFDGERLLLYLDGEKVRRIFVDRDTHRVIRRNFRGQPALGILPASERKAESIWVVQRDADALADVETVKFDDIDKPAIVGPGDWTRIHELVEPAPREP